MGFVAFVGIVKGRVIVEFVVLRLLAEPKVIAQATAVLVAVLVGVLVAV